MDQKIKNGGMGFVSTLTLIFIVLKLLGLIAWSWIWVFAPIWISFVLIVLAFRCDSELVAESKKGKW